jgi:hypothetical protein
LKGRTADIEPVRGQRCVTRLRTYAW